MNLYFDPKNIDLKAFVKEGAQLAYDYVTDKGQTRALVNNDIRFEIGQLLGGVQRAFDAIGEAARDAEAYLTRK